MRSWAVRVVGVLGVVAFSLMMVGAGVASADPYIGKKYSDAAAQIAKRKGKPVVATVRGSELAQDDCIVTNWHKSIFLDSRGKNHRSKEYRLDLNCTNPVAAPGHPGNSAVTPEGAKAKKDQTRAASITEHPEQCQKSEASMKSCVNFCKKTGLCQVES